MRSKVTSTVSTATSTLRSLSTRPGRARPSFAEQLTIPKATADKILAVNGVEAGAGEVFAPVAFRDKNGKVSGGATGRMWVADEKLNPVDVTEGRAPTATGEIAVDKGLADKESLAVGDHVTLLTVDGPHEVTVVGITDFGNADAIDQGGTVSIPETAAFSWLRAGQPEFQSLYLRGSSDPAQLEKAIAPFVPKGFIVQTGDTFRQDKRDEIGQFGQVLKRGLQFFALLALFVGAFVIYNTFNVIVAQRQRELAVLSAIGATPKQLKRSLRYEGLVIGLVGSALGVAVGVRSRTG